MRILLTNLSLRGRTGTEAVIRDLAVNLARRGHAPIVFAKRLGRPARELTAAGIEVTDRLDAIGQPPDVIHGHHNIPALAAMCRFPNAAAVWVSHDTRNWFDVPPLLERIHRYIAVDDLRVDFLVKTHGIAEGRVTFVPNAVDLDRIPPRPRPLPERPATLLAFTKTSGELGIAEGVCRAAGLAFSALGRGAGRTVADPERELVAADIVMAAGRSALEALCAGCAVIVGDSRGMAGLVTPDNYAELRRQNFGRGAFAEPFSAGAVAREIALYDRAACEAVSALARRHASVYGLIDAMERLYCEAIEQTDGIWPANDIAAVERILADWPAKRLGNRWRWRRERRLIKAFLLERPLL